MAFFKDSCNIDTEVEVEKGNDSGGRGAMNFGENHRIRFLHAGSAICRMTAEHSRKYRRA